MKKLLSLSICLLLLSAQPSRAQVLAPEIVLVRIKEYNGSVSMAISRGPGKTEYLEFDSGAFKKQMIAAAEKYHDVLYNLYQEGYVLQSSFSPTIDSNSSTTTLVLSKPAKP